MANTSPPTTVPTPTFKGTQDHDTFTANGDPNVSTYYHNVSSAGMPSSTVGGSPAGTPGVINGSANRYAMDQNQTKNLKKGTKELASNRGGGKDQPAPVVVLLLLPQGMDINMSEKYKGYVIVGDNGFGMKLIKRDGTGALPKMLEGLFTTPVEAMKAIDHAVSLKGDKNAEANITS